MHKTERAQLLIEGNGGRGRTELVYLDIEQDKRQAVWDASGKKGIYPLIFVGDRFIGALPCPRGRDLTVVGDLEQIEDLNEDGDLQAALV